MTEILVFRWITLIAWFAFMIFYFRGGSALFADIHTSVSTTGSYDSTLLLMLMAIVCLALLPGQLMACLGYSRALGWAEQRLVVGAGMMLCFTGIIAACWVRFCFLRQFWAGSVKKHASQQIIEQGPYRIVRHPLYAIFLLIYAGIALASGTWSNLLACGLLMTGYIFLTAYEDEFLAENLSGYKAYQQRTRYRLVPGVW